MGRRRQLAGVFSTLLIALPACGGGGERPDGGSSSDLAAALVDAAVVSDAGARDGSTCDAAAAPKPLPAPLCGTPDDHDSGVGWVGNMVPSPDNPPAYDVAPASLSIAAEVWADGRTNQPGAASGLTSQVWTNVGGSCAAYPMTYANDVGNNDRYDIDLPLAGVAQGVYRYRVRAGVGAGWFYGPEALLLIDPLPAIGQILTAWPPELVAGPSREQALADLDACLLSNYFTGTGGFLDVHATQGRVREYFSGP